MPGLLQYTTNKGCNVASTWESEPKPEDVALWLPSEITADQRCTVCVDGLADVELKLRTSQCADSLRGLRQVLQLKTRLVYYKIKNIRGQKDGTRSRSFIDRVHRQAIQFVLKYRAARRAKLALEGPGRWEAEYQELRNEDVQSYASGLKKTDPDRRGIWEDGHEPPTAKESGIMSSDEESASDIEMGDVARQTEAQLLKKRKKGTGETRKALSWIWRSATVDMKDSGGSADFILRAEWATSRACARQAQEEVQLLREEMRRVLAFLEWSSREWVERGVGRTGVDTALLEGLRSYAKKQSLLQVNLQVTFKIIWKTLLEHVGTAAEPTQQTTVSTRHGGSVEGDGDEDEGDGDGDGEIDIDIDGDIEDDGEVDIDGDIEDDGNVESDADIDNGGDGDINHSGNINSGSDIDSDGSVESDNTIDNGDGDDGSNGWSNGSESSSSSDGRGDGSSSGSDGEGHRDGGSAARNRLRSRRTG